jgi:hypothetical protein
MKTMFVLFAFLLVGSMVALAEPVEKNGTLRHVVSLKFKAGSDKAEIKKVENAFRDLKNKIPGIVSLEWGTNVSPENHAKGFTHCFILGFQSEKDRDAYLAHPEHKKFGKLLGPVMDDVFVIDFWVKE